MADRQKTSATSGEKDNRKKRLTSALRDNLRRRKAAPRPKKPDTQGDSQ